MWGSWGMQEIMRGVVNAVLSLLETDQGGEAANLAGGGGCWVWGQ